MNEEGTAKRGGKLAIQSISVIVPCFNAAGTLERCIEGLLEQQLPNSTIEILVIDNNSRDDTVAIAKRHPTVTLLCEPIQGAYAARNAGLRRAKGEILAFIDPDCVPGSGWLNELTRPFETDSVKTNPKP